MIVAVAGAFCGCASHPLSQEASEPSPIVVRVDDIHFEGWDFQPLPWEDGTAVVSLAFKFKSRSQEQADALYKSSEPARRVVYIMDDDTVMGCGTVVGYVGGVEDRAQSISGLMLRFRSVTEAEQVFSRVREDPWEALDRHLEDRRFWILPNSTGPHDSSLRLPAGGLPRPLSHIYGP